MKVKYIVAFLLLTSGLVASAQEADSNQPPVMIENQSKYNFAETIDILSKVIPENGWKIMVVHDLQETMKKNGKEVLPVKVIELCNPVHAYQILSVDNHREIAPMLPCRIAVYEKTDGNTYLSRMNAPALSVMIGGDAAKTIVGAFDDVEGFLNAVI